MISRRTLLASGALLATSANPLFGALLQARPKHLLLVSSWQTVNIGDIAHTPGMLRLLEQYLPETRVTLWPKSVNNGVDAMLLRAFPRLKIVEGTVDAEGRPVEPALREAFAGADFLLHGSGPSVVGQPQLEAWRKVTGKPYGIYGVTIGAINAALRELLDHSAFVFCRDTVSLEVIRKAGIKSPVMEFAPDATFALHLRDEERALAYMERAGLREREFVGAVPRLRYTPYYKIHNRPPTAEDRRRDAVNEQFAQQDHGKLREAITAFVRETGLKVLACPEMSYQVPLIPELLIDRLPEDVKKNVVYRDTYWRPDEAASVYARALAVLSFEMHSPIIAAANGTPAMYLRQPTDTSKGQMWRDIGLKQWIFEIDETKGEDVARELLALHRDYPGAQRTLKTAMEFAAGRQRDTMAAVGAALGK